MKRLSMMLLALVLLTWGLADANPVPPPPTLNVPGCDELAAEQDSPICVPINLVTNGARVASVGFTLEYDCQVLHLPNGSQDVQPGSVLIEGQNVSAIVQENDTCQVKVVVTPPIKFPIPIISDGDLVQICFMVKTDAPDGCSDITFVPGSADMGDDWGQNIPIDPPTDGGVLVGYEPCGPEVCTGGIDEDCDGLIDCVDPDCDGTTVGACSTGNPGICAPGTLTCSGGTEVCEQDNQPQQEGPPGDPSCSDGLDNDCDGLTDEPDDSDCVWPPETACFDNIDNDQDGLTDCVDPDCDGATDGACSTGKPGICAAGTLTCSGGTEMCVQNNQPQQEGPPGAPNCSDGLDNDCDGLTDEPDDSDCAWPPETACFDNIDNDQDGLTDCEDPDCDKATDGVCSTGKPGICAGGTLTCSGSTEVCEQDNQPQQEGPPGDPSCSDGLDNDCDGDTDLPQDSDCACCLPETNCFDNIDNDNDGLTDCDDPDCIGDVTCYIDHFKCYTTRGKTIGGVVSLADQFETKNMKVRKPKMLCNPVDKNGEGINDPTAHLTCYHVADTKGQPKFQPRDALVENQFGKQTLTVLGAKKVLCVPSEKDLVPSGLNLDHFKCYRARIKKGTPSFEPREVSLSDQFGEGNFKVKNPVSLCNPVSKDDEGIKDPNRHLVCYKIVPRRSVRRNVIVENQFGERTLTVLKPSVLCVPSSKTELSSPNEILFEEEDF